MSGPDDGRDDADHAAYQATGNPVHLWWAIGKFRPTEPLPPWIREALLERARRVGRAAADRSLDPKTASEQAMEGLALVRQGKNLIAEWRQQHNAGVVGWIYANRVRRGYKADSVAEELAQMFKVTSRTIWRLIRRVRY